MRRRLQGLFVGDKRNNRRTILDGYSFQKNTPILAFKKMECIWHMFSDRVEIRCTNAKCFMSVYQHCSRVHHLNCFTGMVDGYENLMLIRERQIVERVRYAYFPALDIANPWVPVAIRHEHCFGFLSSMGSCGKSAMNTFYRVYQSKY